jgi:prolyl-tRNA synthetase
MTSRAVGEVTRPDCRGRRGTVVPWPAAGSGGALNWPPMTDHATQTDAPSIFVTTRRGAVHMWSRTLIPTTRDAPADAELPSHIFLTRAGYIRKVGAGVYDYLPLAKRVLTKIETIIREELDAAGASEMLVPHIVPIELYAGTKRDVDYGDLLMRFTDRHGREAALGPTHEEIVTEMLKGSVNSYKQLPLNVYQIQTKFRDEFRPRAGLLRGREFIMKDAYSFHLTIEGEGGLNETYDKMYTAYVNTFRRCGLDFSVVEAEAGPIGGSASHEFMVNCATGEDTIMVCPASGYAANVEKCEIGDRAFAFDAAPSGELTTHHTPGMPGIDLVAQHLGTTPDGMLKTIVMQPATERADGVKWVLAVVRGDHEVNEGKVRDAVGFPVEMGDEKAARGAGFAIGYVSPRAATAIEGCLIVIDPDATGTRADWATGSDKVDHHDTGFNWTRDFGGTLPAAGPVGPDKLASAGSVKVADIRNAVAGDPSPRAAGSVLEARRGIEVGHIFKLGTKYSDAFEFSVLDAQQQRQPVIMGCYGIGVSRTMAACVEMSHDENGIIWPAPVAPYHALISLVKPEDEPSQQACEQIARELSERGVDVLIDDRKERPGVKFKDADLIGIPVRITIGPKTLEKGGAEVKGRREDGFGDLVAVDEVSERVLIRLAGT